MWLDSTIALKQSAPGSKVEMVDEAVSPLSLYQPSDEEKQLLNVIRMDFVLGDLNMNKPRREFNDLSVLERDSVDTMTWNTYQPNDGDNLEGDEVNAWRSNAMRPVTRNKVLSITAHTTARIIFPHMFAFDSESKEDQGAAQVMNDLFEWSTVNNSATYLETSIYAVLAACVAPASLVYTEYAEVYRKVKMPKADGTYDIKNILDEDESGFKDEVVPVNQLYIADFYEPNIQKQRFLIWRRVRDYSTLKEKWGHLPNFKYVKPGVMILYNDANNAFYETYDANMRPYEAEEVLYWNRHLDLFQVVVNGVLLTPADNANPREDKLYPWAKFFYEPISPQNRCFYGKSLVFKNMPDDKVINTLYPMVMDGTYLALMPPQMVTGGEIIGSDVMIPGAVTTLSDPNASVQPLLTASQNLKAAYDAMLEVEKSMDESTLGNDQPEQIGQGTAYEISKLEQKAKTLLGLFIKMETLYVKQFSRLRIGDIKQHLTLPDVLQLEGTDNPLLVYKTFMLNDRGGTGNVGVRKIRFTLDHPTEPMSQSDVLAHSYKLLSEFGADTKGSLVSAHPQLFRNLNYMAIVSPDVVSPMSEEVLRAFDLEQYDRMIANPVFDPEQTGRLLLQAYDKTKKDPDKYLAKAPQQATGGNMAVPPPNPPPASGSPVASPVQPTPFGSKPIIPR